MARSIIKFKNTGKNLFKVCDEWAKNHKSKTIESTESSRLYSRKQGVYTPLAIFFRPSHRIKVSLNSGTVSVECWIASSVSGETEVSSSSAFQPLGIKIFKKQLRNNLNGLLIRLNQEDKLVH
jgi:hypothetical protein